MTGPDIETRHQLDLGGERFVVFDRQGPSPDAPTVMLIHGFGVTARLNWSKSYDGLATHFRVLSMDLRGHGSGAKTHRFSLEQCADDAVACALALGVSSLYVVGYSMGGPIATLAWRRHRSHVAGLVLAATMAKFAPRVSPTRLRMFTGLAKSFARMNPDWIMRRARDWALFRIGEEFEPAVIADELAGHDVKALVEAGLALVSYDGEQWLHEVDVPVTVLVTSDDDRVSPQNQRELAQLIPNANIIETPGTHAACIINQKTFAPDLLRACIDVHERAATRSPAAAR